MQIIECFILVLLYKMMEKLYKIVKGGRGRMYTYG